MSTGEDDLLRMPGRGGKAAQAASAAAGGENKPAKPTSDLERPVCGSPAITDSTKRFRLSNSQEQATLEGPGMLQPKARRAPGPSFTANEAPQKSMFSLRLTRSKKEKHIPHNNPSSPNADANPKGGRLTSVAKEDGACHVEQPPAEVSQAVPPTQENNSKGEVKSSASTSSLGSSVD